MLRDGNEIAVLDVREEGVFAKRHLLLASNAPLSRLELRAPLLVPRRSTRVVLVDADDGRAERAASTLAANGYTRVQLLSGGIEGWTKFYTYCPSLLFLYPRKHNLYSCHSRKLQKLLSRTFHNNW